ncbi:hydantoinase/oxoprolinase family protein [Salinibaculum salinum]|uniref:hydantoinase/oxoprolinase family protein n=1 Tax=Salinibaculum salinum TaxID=3131996 RepID=UPI0030ED3CDC
MNRSVRLAVDVGGTFTDIVLITEDGVTTAKVPTTESDQSDGVLAGIETACEDAGVDPSDVDQFRHAMTVATNALLEEDGARTALVTTAGFGDVLKIGRQDRPDLYDHSARKPDPLVPAARRFEVDERALPDRIEQGVSSETLEEIVDVVEQSDAESVAISFLHAYAHPENEREVAERLREQTDVPVAASHETLAAFREYERTATTVADAYVRPVIDRYLGRFEGKATERGLPSPRVMQSNGGIADAATVRTNAVTTALSGPAAGVVGASLFDPETHDGIITFDMGGTSSDVSLVRDGMVEETTEADVGDHPVRVPMVDIETVGAGGGSVAWVDAGGALRVGPRSAGAEPGPACYGRGGTEPTVTDANLALGYLGTDTELGDGLTLDETAARNALEEITDGAELGAITDVARGIYRVANATMARTIRRVTVERGHDPREFALIAFGGAGPMHAVALADRLDIGTVVVPRANGVLSALGLLAADERHDEIQTHRAALADVDISTIEDRYTAMTETVLAETSSPDEATIGRGADLRYAGQSHELTVSVPDPFDAETVADRFGRVHEQTRGYRLDDEPIELINLRVTSTIEGTPPDISHEGSIDAQTGTREAHFDGVCRETAIYDRDRLSPGTDVAGPVIFEGGESTVVLPPDWRASVDERGTLTMEATR